MIRAFALRLARDQAGVSIVEFALIAPVLLMAIMGLFDMGYNMWTTAMLQGSIQQAARNSTLEGAAASPAQLDAIVTRAVQDVQPGAVLTFDRKSYSSFSNVSQPEDYNDVNANGTCDAGEPFEDINDNGNWDTDRGMAGQGGARDAVLYTVTVTFTRGFPIAGLIGASNEMSLQAQSVLRNQPYDLQQNRAPVAGNCI